MISLTQENRIAVPTAGFDEAVYIFPSFKDMTDSILRLQRRKMLIQSGDVKDRTNPERIRLFDEHVKATENLPARNAEGDLVELSSMEGWKGKIPGPVKVAAAGVFDEGEGKILPAEAFGDPVRVEVSSPLGSVTFLFPSLDDPGMSKNLTFLMEDRIRQRGRRIQDRSLDVRLEFFKRTCQGYEGVEDNGASVLEYLPTNWIVAAVRAFERSEALSDDDLGN